MKYFIYIFIFLFSNYIIAQEPDAFLKKLEEEVRLAKTAEVKIDAMLNLSEYQYKRDFLVSEKTVDKALLLIEHKKNAISQSQLAKAYIIKGIVNRRKANYSESLNYYIKALEYYEKKKDTSKIADVYHNMGLVYRYQKEHNKAIDKYKKAIEFQEKVKDTLGIAMSYNMLGVSYRQSKQLDKALSCYKKAEGIFIKFNSQENLHGVYGNLGALYGSQKKFELSLPLKFKNLTYYKKIGKKLSLCVEYYNISNDYKRMKDFKLSQVYADSSLQIALKQQFKERIAKAYLRKSFTNRKLGDYKNAYESYRKFNRYSDSIFNIEQTKKIQSLELNYKFDKEKTKLELINKSESSKKTLYFVLFLFSIISALVIGFLLRRNYLQKIKITQIRAENEKKTLNETLEKKEKGIRQLVTDNTMRVIFKQDLLNRIKNEVINEKPEQIKNKLSSVIAELQLQIISETKRDNLQKEIDKINIDFNRVLQSKFPNLTKGEREVCTLLYLNLSIKEIMVVRGVSIDSVKSMRRRIRKKMKVSAEIKLEDFIQELF